MTSDPQIKQVLGGVVDALCLQLDEKEKRQDKVLALSREIVRDCAKAIRHLHTGETSEAAELLADLREKMLELGKISEGFENIAFTPYQEYVEASVLKSVLDKQKIPSPKELGVPVLAYLSGFADCAGELRRSLQLALKNGDKHQAEYLFKCMNELYDELMVLKYSSSLVGPLKRKQDMVRGQLENARSEMLRS